MSWVFPSPFLSPLCSRRDLLIFSILSLCDSNFCDRCDSRCNSSCLPTVLISLLSNSAELKGLFDSLIWTLFSFSLERVFHWVKLFDETRLWESSVALHAFAFDVFISWLRRLCYLFLIWENIDLILRLMRVTPFTVSDSWRAPQWRYYRKVFRKIISRTKISDRRLRMIIPPLFCMRSSLMCGCLLQGIHEGVCKPAFFHYNLHDTFLYLTIRAAGALPQAP